jgi:hypothetical protein
MLEKVRCIFRVKENFLSKLRIIFQGYQTETITLELTGE